jgi:ADP-ribose pyrophosphatase
VKDDDKIPPFTRKDIQMHHENVVYEGYFTVKSLSYQHAAYAGGVVRKESHEVLFRPPAVVVLPYDPEADSVVLVEQVRTGVVAVADRNPWLCEVVAGMLEASDSPISGAERELFEETQLRARAWEKIAQYWVSPGGTTEEVIAYCALVDSSQAGQICGLADEGEDIRVCVFTVQDILAKLANAEINNSATIICLQWLQANRSRLQKMWSTQDPR